MSTAPKKYSAGLLKGTGSLDETLVLLDLWELGMSESAFVLQAPDMLAKRTRLRALDIARTFAQRYLAHDASPARHLKALRAAGASPSDFRLLLFLHTARAQPILHDYVTRVYWPLYGAGAPGLPRTAADAFLERALAAGDVEPWSESTRIHMAQNLNGTLTDFGLLTATPSTNRRFTPPVLSDLLAGYLAYDARDLGFSDSALADHPDWALFGLDRYAVVQMLHRLGRAGHLLVQDAGDLLRISWTYPSLDAALDALV